MVVRWYHKTYLRVNRVWLYPFWWKWDPVRYHYGFLYLPPKCK